MSDHQDKKQGATRKQRPPEASPSKRLTDRVTFYEKVWTGSQTGSFEGGGDSILDLEDIEKRLTKQERQDGSFEETSIHSLEEGDAATGLKTVKFEKVTVRKSVKSRTPSEEKLIEDSAYHTESFGNGLPYSKSSSITSLTGRFPSEESLSRVSSSREQSKDEWDSNSNSMLKNRSDLQLYEKWLGIQLELRLEYSEGPNIHSGNISGSNG
ncbi:hypothetical protein MML48_5g00001532 [Holotrichia oblita]|uniref:Uncharacterized protein n=1 Tax=Holotrichia oblita TaxID=644536 RepID=A0ACB9T5U8_HOLOL|nr:hypothetical protein MML48_5g00001532 [Holotrichia oblita]